MTTDIVAKTFRLVYLVLCYDMLQICYLFKVIAVGYSVCYLLCKK